VFIKNDNINLAATSLTAPIANTAALVGREPRQPGTALVYLCAHEELSDAGTVKDLERRPTQQRADRLNLGRATSSLTSACRPQVRASLFRDGEWTHHRATPASGSPRRWVVQRTLTWPPPASPRTFEATTESALKVLTQSTAYQPRMRNRFCIYAGPRPCSPQSRPVSPQSMVAMITVEPATITVEHPPCASSRTDLLVSSMRSHIISRFEICIAFASRVAIAPQRRR
jgi:hypothetical protein